MLNIFVSVIIPAYNPGLFIIETIKSILNQTHQNFEIIIIDDGSTIDFKKDLDLFFNNNDKIRYFFQPNQGLASARNMGIDNSLGDYIAFLDSDDLWFRNKLEEQLNYITFYDLIYTNYQIINEQSYLSIIHNKNLNHHQITSYKTELLIDNFIHGSGSSVIVSKELLNKVGYFDINLNYGEDWDYWLRCAHLNFKFFHLQEDLVLIRRHSSSMQSTINTNVRFDNIKKILFKYQKSEYVNTVAFILFRKASLMKVSFSRFIFSLFFYIRSFSFSISFSIIFKFCFIYFYSKFKFLIKNSFFD